MDTNAKDKTLAPYMGKVVRLQNSPKRRYLRDDNLILFGSKVKQARKIAGYSQQELAMLMGLSGSSVISQVETGKIGLELRNIYRLAEVLGVRVEILINGKSYTNAELRKHMKYYEIMHNPNHPMRPALDAILSMND